MLQKTITILFFLASVFFSAKSQLNRSDNPHAFLLSGKIKGAEDGSIYLTRSTAQGWVVDSALLKNGRFEFKGKIDEPSYAELALYSLSGSIYEAQIFIEPAKMNVNAEKKNFRFLQLEGSIAQNDFEKLNNMKKDSWTKMDLLKKEIAAEEERKTKAIAPYADTIQKRIDKLDRGISPIEREMYRSDSFFIRQNPGSYVAAYLACRNMNFERFKLPADSFYYGLPEPVKNTSYGKEILWMLNAAKIAPVGGPAPIFVGKDQIGNEINLSDFRNKACVLLDFWGSWCGPCRTMNEYIKTFYQQYGNQGLQVISVAINDKEKDWRKAIADDNTGAWLQILDNSSNTIKDLYAANSVPLYFLIDKNGVIIGRYRGSGERSYSEESFIKLAQDLKNIFVVQKKN